ncbi:MAG: galactose mutarotase [Labilithrix sp.]|nr:galactose mutarotase [Labilithrix sp.]
MSSLETVTLHDPSAGSRVLVAPSRGGMITRFSVGDREVMFLDEATLLDATKNVRGGNPVLFPSPGPLAGDRFAWGGKSGSMKQHGFARQRAWSVVASAERAVTLELRSDDETRAAYPWDFVVRIRYALAGARLAVETTVANRSADAMPFALGFHPYFHVPDVEKARCRVTTDATRAFDNVTKTTSALAGIDLTQKEVDLHLIDHGPHESTLELADGSKVVVSADPSFRRWVVWTLAGKDFVCLEPWTAPADALNRDESLIVLAPNESRSLSVAITAR